jgi:hypothetical protein
VIVEKKLRDGGEKGVFSLHITGLERNESVRYGKCFQ